MMSKKLWITFILTLFLVAACGGREEGESFATPIQPELQLASNSGSTAGQTIVACWPQGQGNIACDINAPTDAGEVLAVRSGDTVSVLIQGDADAPDKLVVTTKELSDDGLPLVNLSLDPGENFVVSLPVGLHTIEITAYYDDLEDASASLTSSFMLDVAPGDEVALNLTPTDTPAEGTDEPTEETTLEATEEADTTPVVSLTDDGPSDGTPVALDGTEVSDGTPVMVATTPAVSPTDDATRGTPVLAATTPSISQTPVTVATDTPAPPTHTPSVTATPTATFTATATFTPSNTPTPTATATFTPSPTPTGAPPIVVAISGITYSPASTIYCKTETTGQTCIESVSDAARVQAQLGSAVTVSLSGERPTGMTYKFLNNQSLEVLSQGSRQSSSVFLFNVDVASTGLYVLQIDLFWPDRQATYFYQLRVR